MPNALTIWAIRARHLLSHVLTFELLNVRGQQHSFSTHERMFFISYIYIWNIDLFTWLGYGPTVAHESTWFLKPRKQTCSFEITSSVKFSPHCPDGKHGVPRSRAHMMTSSNGDIFNVTGHHKRQCRGALMFSLICAWINGCANNGEAGDLIRHRAHYDVTVMINEDE